jgi:hypothetical protein
LFEDGLELSWAAADEKLKWFIPEMLSLFCKELIEPNDTGLAPKNIRGR